MKNSRLQMQEIFWLRKDREIDVATKFRSAVKHARLTAHQQAADAMTPHRRKDCLCRVPVQVSLLVREMCSRGCWIVSNVLLA